MKQNSYPSLDPTLETPGLTWERRPPGHPGKWVRGRQRSSLSHRPYHGWSSRPHLGDATARCPSRTTGALGDRPDLKLGGQNADPGLRVSGLPATGRAGRPAGLVPGLGSGSELGSTGSLGAPAKLRAPCGCVPLTLRHPGGSPHRPPFTERDGDSEGPRDLPKGQHVVFTAFPSGHRNGSKKRPNTPEGKLARRKPPSRPGSFSCRAGTLRPLTVSKLCSQS